MDNLGGRGARLQFSRFILREGFSLSSAPGTAEGKGAQEVRRQC